MPETYREFVYIGWDNTIDLAISENTQIRSLESVTRVTAELVDEGGAVLELDSALNPEYFDWVSRTNVLVLRLGQAGLTAGKVYEVNLVIYDPDHTNGLLCTSDEDNTSLDTLIIQAV